MKTAAQFFNDLDNNRAIKWGGLSDVGKRARSIEFTKLYIEHIEEEIIDQLSSLPSDSLNGVALVSFDSVVEIIKKGFNPPPTE
jgi:hypothetical protein